MELLRSFTETHSTLDCILKKCRGSSFAWTSYDIYASFRVPFIHVGSANNTYEEHDFCGAVSNSSLIVARIHPLPVKPVGIGYCMKSFRITALHRSFQ